MGSRNSSRFSHSRLLFQFGSDFWLWWLELCCGWWILGFYPSLSLALPGQYTDLWCRPSNGWCPGEPPSLSSLYLLLSYSDTLPIAFHIWPSVAGKPFPILPHFTLSLTVPILCYLCADYCFTWSLLTSFYRTHLLMNLQYCTSPLSLRHAQGLLAYTRQFCFSKLFIDHSSGLNACIAQLMISSCSRWWQPLLPRGDDPPGVEHAAGQLLAEQVRAGHSGGRSPVTAGADTVQALEHEVSHM